MDQRGTDNPPIFYLDTQIAHFKYHALLTEPIDDKWEMLMDLNRQDQEMKEVEGEIYVTRPRGLYGFTTIEARDKFCKRANFRFKLASESDEAVTIALPVTVPNLVMTEPMDKQIRYQSGD